MKSSFWYDQAWQLGTSADLNHPKPDQNSYTPSFLQGAIAFFSGSSEPRVWKTQDQQDTLWNAYDPTSGKTVRKVSEDQLRVWLEERHYHS